MTDQKEKNDRSLCLEHLHCARAYIYRIWLGLFFVCIVSLWISICDEVETQLR